MKLNLTISLDVSRKSKEPKEPKHQDLDFDKMEEHLFKWQQETNKRGD